MDICQKQIINRLPGSNRDRASQPERRSGEAAHSLPIWTTPVLVHLEKANPGFGSVQGDCTRSRSNSRMNHANLSVVMGIRRPVPTPAGVSGEQGTTLRAAGRAMPLLSFVAEKSRLLDAKGPSAETTCPITCAFLAIQTQYIGGTKFSHDFAFSNVD